MAVYKSASKRRSYNRDAEELTESIITRLEAHPEYGKGHPLWLLAKLTLAINCVREKKDEKLSDLMLEVSNIRATKLQKSTVKLERTKSEFQGSDTNFETYVYKRLIDVIEETNEFLRVLSKIRDNHGKDGDAKSDEEDLTVKRAAAKFLISQGDYVFFDEMLMDVYGQVRKYI